jgi:hypothetical protein
MPAQTLFREKNYPLVDSRDLQPSFEPELFEYTDLPGFSMVALERPLNYFNEIFQYDKLTSRREPSDFATGSACLLKRNIHAANVRTFLNRLPKTLQEDFVRETYDMDITALPNYPVILGYLLHMDRARSWPRTPQASSACPGYTPPFHRIWTRS